MRATKDNKMRAIKGKEGEVLYVGDFDSVKECAEQAVENWVSLVGANFEWANLQGVNFRRAKLKRSNFIQANLYNADFRDAYLNGADFSYADLEGCVGNMKEIKSMQLEQYMITYTATRLQIGCTNLEIAQWWDLSDDDIDYMDEGALEFWKKWKDVIKNIIEISPAIGNDS